jgi:LCP family protein required for cell wall assembly
VKFEQTEEKDQPIESRVRARKKSNKGWRKIALLTFALVAGLLVYNVVALMKFFDQANKNQFAAIGNDVNTVPWKGNEQVNILFLGVDNREKDVTPRSDTMLLLSINPDTRRASLLSIMRDTYVNVPSHGKNKINTAFAIGGPNLAVKTVEDFLRIPVQYYVVTDFKGFEGIVDAIGGVDLNVEIPMAHADDGVYDIRLKQGMQHLNGKEALQYVRYRGDARADFARTERQRKFVKAVIQELKTPLTLVRFPSMLQSAEPYVQTNMDTSDIMRLSTGLLRLEENGFQSVQIPPDHLLTETYNYLGESILQPDVAGIRKFVQETLQSDDSAPVSSQANGSATGTNGGSGKTGTDNGTTGTNGSSGTGGTAGAKGSGTSGVSGGDQGNAGAGSELTGSVTEGANVRQGPGTNYPIVSTASPGQEFWILKQEAGWYHVRLHDGTVGYIFGELVVVNAQ